MGKSPVSDKVTEFLSAYPGDSSYKVSTAFEFLHLSDPPSKDTLAAAVVVTRGKDNLDTFLIGALSNIELVDEGKSQYIYTVRPVNQLLGFLGLKPGSLPVCDGVFLGPLDMESSMKILEIYHAVFKSNQESLKADSLRKAFLESMAPEDPVKPAPHCDIEMGADGSATVFRPSIWDRRPS